MTKPPTWLLEHARDVYSQWGEDGVTEALLDVLPDRDRWCVEFGAWDGMHLSNSRHLIESHGYSAVLIEGDASRFEALRRNYAARDDIFALHAFVGVTADNNLEHLLASTPIPEDFDFLSIDIDGNDYHAWKATTRYRPKVVCLEFNPTVPTELVWVQPADPARSHGAGIGALVELGREKGYELAAVTRFNAFFIRGDLFPLLEIEDNRATVLRTDTQDVTYLFSGYDGTIFLVGSASLPWHELAIPESRVQQLPRFLRRFPDDYGLGRRCLFYAFKLLREPSATVAEIRRKVARRREASNHRT